MNQSKMVIIIISNFAVYSLIPEKLTSEAVGPYANIGNIASVEKYWRFWVINNL